MKNIIPKLEEYKSNSGGKFDYEFLDPVKDTSLAESISSNFGFKPQAISLFAEDTFYFYLTVHDGDNVYNLGIPEDHEKVDSFNKALDAALMRIAPGFLKTVGVYTPPSNYNPMLAQYGMPQQESSKQFKAIQQKLGGNYRSIAVDLKSGTINPEVDILLVLAPKDLSDEQVFAIDQYLMRGATVIMSTSPIAINKNSNDFSSSDYTSGLKDWLLHHGVDIESKFVFDKRNSNFPVISKQMVQGVAVRLAKLQPYPLFLDVRESGLNQDIGITSSLGQLTFAWGSPIIIDDKVNKDRNIVELIKSSNES